MQWIGPQPEGRPEWPSYGRRPVSVPVILPGDTGNRTRRKGAAWGLPYAGMAVRPDDASRFCPFAFTKRTPDDVW